MRVSIQAPPDSHRQNTAAITIDDTVDVGVQTEYIGDLSDMPSAHDERLAAHHGVRGEEGRERMLIRARMSHWSIPSNKVG